MIIIFLLLITFGIVIGLSISYLIYNELLVYKNLVIDDYKKGIKIHNYRELRLIFISQSTKDYVKQQQDILKKSKCSNICTNEDYIKVGKYWAYKDIEAAIKQFEKNSEDLIKD